MPVLLPLRPTSSGARLILLPVVAVEILAVALAWTLALRRPEHRWLAALMTWALSLDLARAGLQMAALAPWREAHALPYAGAARVAFHVCEALLLAWPASLLGAVLVAFEIASARRAAVVAAGVLGAGVVAAVASYPAVRLEARSAALAAVWGLLLGGMVVAVGIAVRRLRPAPWGPAQYVVATLAAGEAGVVVAALRSAPLLRDAWDRVGQAYGVAWLVAAGYLGAEAWRCWRSMR